MATNEFNKIITFSFDKIPNEKNKISNKDLEYKNNTLNIDFNNIEKDMLSLKSSETKIENIFAMLKT